MDLNVSKGGISWVEFSLGRNLKGLEVFVRAAPEIEAFIKSLGNGKTDPIENYGTEWFPISTETLTVHRTDKSPVYGDSWTLDNPGESIVNHKELGLKVNLSFLKLVGVGSLEGIRFGVKGPFGKNFIEQYGRDIVAETKKLVQQYIVPVHVNLKIFSGA